MTSSPQGTADAVSSTADIAGATSSPDLSQKGQGSNAPPADPQMSSEDAPHQAPPAADRADAGGGEDQVDLMEAGESERFRSQWTSVQVTFVDEPRRAVESADALVADVMKRLAEGFAEGRSRLEGHWDRGDDVSTEDLRLALQRYRSFFNRLLTT